MVVALSIGTIIFLIGITLMVLPNIASKQQWVNSSTISTNPSLPDDADSNLIPKGKLPVLKDSLQDNSQGNEWTTPHTNLGTCSFTNGQFVASASGGTNNGVLCWSASPSNAFSNFVYQIKMTILEGGDDSNGTAVGLLFRLNINTNQYYSVTFDVNGDWSVQKDSGELMSSSSTCHNPCLAFHTGLNQSNFITVRMINSIFQIQVNGQALGSYTDDTYSSGATGVIMDPGKDATQVAFSDVRVWKL